MNYPTITEELKEVILDALKQPEIEEAIKNESYDSNNRYDLHDQLFNEDYYIIGYWNAEQWLIKHDVDAFEVIHYVKAIEERHFGKMTTDMNSEAIANSFVYWYAMEVIDEITTELNIK